MQSDFIQRANNDLLTGNALKQSVQFEVEPWLSNSERFSGASTKAWYLFASRQDAAMIVAFLQGKQTPRVEFTGLDADPNRLSATWRVFFDCSAALGDFRAAYKSKGEPQDGTRDIPDNLRGDEARKLIGVLAALMPGGRVSWKLGSAHGESSAENISPR